MKSIINSLFVIVLIITASVCTEAANKIMLSPTGLNPKGIYFGSAEINSSLTFGFPSFHSSGVISYSYPVVSPNGQLFARFEQDMKKRRLVVRKVADGALVVVTELDGYNPQWMPGSAEVFFETRIGAKSVCSTISVNDTNNIKKVGELTNQYYPPSEPGLGAAALSMDAQKIVYIRSHAAQPGLLTPYIYDIASQKEDPAYPPNQSGKLDDTVYRRIVFASGPAAPLTIRHISWSPDRKKICAFGTVSFEKLIPGDTAHYWETKTGIFVISIISNEIRTIFETKNFAQDNPENFFFSPDGSKVAFNANIGGPTQTLIAIADRTRQYKILGRGGIVCGETSKQYWALNPWSPDGKSLLYLEDNILMLGYICEESQPIMQQQGQIYLQDAQWCDFSAKTTIAPDINLVNPYPDLQNENGIVQNPGLLAAVWNPVEGIAADGAGKLLVRIKVNSNEAADIFVSLDSADCARGVSGNPLEDGYIYTVQENAPDPSQRTLALKSNPKINNIAYFIYNAPLDFARQGTDDSTKGERTIQIAIIINENLYYVNIKIRRPPVYLLHGVWSSQNLWDDFYPLGTPAKTSADPRFTVYRGDFMPYNNRQVDTITARYNSKGELKAGILKDLQDVILEYSKDNRIVALQADIICHSLGGIVTRSMADTVTSSVYYFNKSNYHKGLVHKLITMDSPHLGSEYCNALFEEYRDEDETGKKFMDYLLYSKLNNGSELFPKSPIGGGAIGNLTTKADRLFWLNHPENTKNQPPLHTICGSASQQIIEPNNFTYGLAIWALLDERWEFEPFNLIFGNKEHDMIVSLNSQMADGLFDNQPTRVTVYEAVHSAGFETEKIITSAKINTPGKVIELLNAGRNSDLFSTNGRFSGSIEKENDDDEQQKSSMETGSKKPDRPEFSGNIKIISPTDNSILNTGEVLNVEVNNESSVSINKVLLSAFGNSFIDSVPPYIFQVSVPMEYALGNSKISAYGIDSTGVIYRDNSGAALADEINARIKTNAGLVSIKAGYKKLITFNEVETEAPAYVNGFFTDYKYRDISRDELTKYNSANENIAKVENGVIKSINPGTTFIEVENSGKRDTLRVVIESGNTPPVAVVMADSIIEPFVESELDASLSTDTDGNIVSYHWEVVFMPSGSVFQLSSPESAKTTFSADLEGYYVIKLRVTDNKIVSSEKYASILVAGQTSIRENGNLKLQFDVQFLYSKDELNIKLVSLVEGNINIDIFDLMGNRLIHTANELIHPGTNNINLSLPDLLNGMYFMRFNLNGVTLVRAFPVVR